MSNAGRSRKGKRVQTAPTDQTVEAATRGIDQPVVAQTQDENRTADPRVVEIRRVVSLAGKVLDDATGTPIAGAHVRISSGPPEFEARRRALAQNIRAATSDDRVDQRLTGADGDYAFANLPDGDYRLQADAPQGAQYRPITGDPITVKRAHDAQGRLQIAAQELRLPRIEGSGNDPTSAKEP